LPFRVAWLLVVRLHEHAMIKRRTFWVLLIGIIAAAVVLVGSYPILHIHYVLARCESAKTPQEEWAAFRLVRPYPYRRVDQGPAPGVRASEGHEFTFSVLVDTPFGHRWYSAHRMLLAQTNLDYLTETVLGTHY
jgi:hypothetical protein